MCLVFFNTSCGLDVISILIDDPVTGVESIPNENTTAFESCYFKFSTQKVDNANDMGKGYVYYKIYNKLDVMTSERNSLTSRADNSTGKYESAHYLINYGYKELNYTSDNGSSTETLVLDNTSQDIRIRLTNYDDSSELHSASVLIDGKKKGVPVRNNGFSFDFGRSGSNDKLPVASDDDTPAVEKFPENQGENENGLYYVALFYFFEMFNDDFSPNRSPIHYLGTVTIDSKVIQN